jgi:hypothetical protein
MTRAVENSCSPPQQAPDCHSDAFCHPSQMEHCAPPDCAPHGCEGLSLHLSLDIGLDFGHDCHTV